VTWNVGCLFLVFVAGGASGAGAGVALRKGITLQSYFSDGIGTINPAKNRDGSGFMSPGTWNCPDSLGLQKPSKRRPKVQSKQGSLGFQVITTTSRKYIVFSPEVFFM